MTGTVEFVPTRMRSVIANTMAESKRRAPHFYVSRDVDMQRAVERLAERNATAAPATRISVTALVVYAAAQALARHRRFNAVWDGDRILMHKDVNVGIAVRLSDGLVAPALMRCESRNLADIGAGLHDLVDRARQGRLRSSEAMEGTFTLTSLAAFGVTWFSGIIVPPQVAILAVGTTRTCAVVRGGLIVAGAEMTATLSADHRVVDGADAAEFLATFASFLEGEDPFTL